MTGTMESNSRNGSHVSRGNGARLLAAVSASAGTDDCLVSMQVNLRL